MRLATLASAAVLVALVACADAGDGAKDDGAKPAPATSGKDAAGATDPPLALTQTILLPGVNGRIDHLALDAKRRRVYVAALGNGSLEVVSLEKGARLRSVGGLEEPQGVAYLAGVDRVAVACGGDGTVRFFDGEKTEPAGKADLGDDADNVHADAAGKRLWVAFGGGGLAAIDPATMQETGRAPLDVHPEGFALEASGKRAFVNLASRGDVAVVDRESLRVTAHWKVGGASANFPIALDEAAQRIYVGCRSPSRLVVLSTDDGKVVAAETCTQDPDDVFIDAGRRRLYVVCGGGNIDVFDLTDAGPKLRTKVATERGARTALLDETTGTIFLAVPRRGAKDAELRVYTAR